METLRADFNKILRKLFNNSNYSQQPRFLVELDCQDGEMLNHAFDFVKAETERGKNLTEFPFEVVALISDPTNLEIVRKNLAHVPHRIAQINGSIQEALISIDIQDQTTCLFLQVTSEYEFQLNSRFGIIHLQKHEPKMTPDQYLLQLAKKGWFPKEGFCFSYPTSTLIYFEQRPYIVRPALLSELPVLIQIESSNWSEDLRIPQSQLTEWINRYPEGQLVIETPEGIEGVVYSQRIGSIEPLYKIQSDRLHTLFDPKGAVIQLIALFVRSEQQHSSMGGQLLEFMLQKATLTPTVTHVTGLTRCVNYPGPSIMSMEDYLKQKTAEGEILDPVPRMHIQHGAEIKGLVPNYRPKDKENAGYGILIVYNLENRQIALEKKESIQEDEISVGSISSFVEETILDLLAHCGGLVEQDNRSLYSRNGPLMDMGLDSLQLLELSGKLTDRFQIELEPTFFFEYGTPEKVIQYIIGRKIELYKEWLYEVTWKPEPIKTIKPYIHDRLWIVLHESGEFQDQLCQNLEANHQYCIRVTQGKEFKKINDQSFEINPNQSKDFVELIKAIPNFTQLAGVINLWGYNVPQKEVTLSSINNYLRVNCEGLIFLANALAVSHPPEFSRLWVVDNSIISDGTKSSLYQTPYAALCKVIASEYPKSKCTHLALDPKLPTVTNVDIICNELRESIFEGEIAYRNGTRMVERMIPLKIKKVQRPHFDEKSSYLVAGGLRPLGLEVARWYIEHGVKTLIILDELEITEEVIKEVDQLKALGAKIVIYTASFDSRSNLEYIFHLIKKEHPPLKGVIHTAGVVEQDLLMHINWDKTKHINRLKIAGSWHLHELTLDLSLDHFVLFSTCLNDLAPMSKASSSIGNTFLDALCHYRKSHELPALSIDWGPWELRKMVVQHVADTTLASGVKVQTLHEGLKILDTIFYNEKAQITASLVEWDLFFHRAISENPLFRDIAVKFETKKAVAEKAIAPIQINEPIAIIGMGCRFPGGANSPEKFWQIFKEGIDTITEVPPDRWDIDAYYDPDKKTPGKMYTRWGGFIDNVDMFDPQFFGISPREAEDMDPQHRICLEVTWEALENAGIAPNTLKGSNTGVFIGICFNDYGHLITQSGDVDAVDGYYSTGNHYSVSAGRISYILGLQGPAMALDTACSSSLVAIDAGIKNLHLGDCDMVIAGGVNLILAPESTINFCKSGMLSEDGRCKTFDSAANGYVRSEGCGIVILKRLSDAQRDKNRILAVIRSVAINQDGASTGLTVPNGEAQEKVIREALQKANLKGKDIDYVEAHGTGTSLGDPIEVKAIVATYGQNRDKPLIIGSAKTNMGHTEAAAGVAGLIKCVLALQNGMIPKHLHFNKLNPHITIDEKLIQIPKEGQSLSSETHRFGVSSFGFSGTNSHAIVESAPKEDIQKDLRSEYAILLSGMSKKAVIDKSKQLKGYLETHPEADLGRIAYTLQLGRKHFATRAAVICSDIKSAIKGIENVVVVASTKEGKFISDPSKDLRKAVDEWVNGADIDWTLLYSEKLIPLELPTYPFQRDSYWEKSAIKSKINTFDSTASQHPFLSEKHLLATGGVLTKGILDIYREPLFQDHRVYDLLIFPAAGFIDAALFAAGGVQLNNVSIEAPLSLSKHREKSLEVLLIPNETGYHVRLDSQTGDNTNPEWIKHLTANVSEITKVPSAKVVLNELMKKCNREIPKTFYYEDSAKSGLDYRSNFQTLDKIYIGENQALGRIIHSTDKHRYRVHPAIVDGCLQLVAALKPPDAEGVYLPIGFDSIAFYNDLPTEFWVHATLRTTPSKDILNADIILFDDAENVIGEISGYTAKHVLRDTFIQLVDKTQNNEDIFYVQTWEVTKDPLGDLPNNWAFVDQNPDLELLLKQKGCKVESFASGKHYENIVYSGDMNEAILSLIQNLVLPTYLWIIKKTQEYMKGGLIGFVRTARSEYPNLNVKLIEYEEINDLTDAFRMKTNESHMITKDGQWHVPRLQRIDIKKNILKPLPFKKDCSYLITGGLGGLGFALAQHLVKEKEVKSIVLIARNNPTQDQQVLLDQLKSQGIIVSLFKANVANFDDIKNIVEKINKTLPPLKGIFHIAGTLDDGIIQHQTWERFEKVFSPKIKGIINLHEATKDIALDHFVAYSSIVSILGLSGQSNYAAANSFMDSFIDYRRKLGLAAQSINWGPWGEVGMAIRQHMNVPGMYNLSLRQGLDALCDILCSNLSHIIVSPVDWPTYFKSYNEVPQLFSKVYHVKETHIQKTAAFDLKENLEKAVDRDKFLEVYLLNKVKTILALREDQPLELTRGFFEVGMDSLMANDLKNQLQIDIGDKKTLNQTLVFTYPNVANLITYYKKEIFPEFFVTKVLETEKVMEKIQKETVDEVEKMTPDDIDRLLEEDL